MAQKILPFESARVKRPESKVSILQYKRFDKFRETLLESPELETCREALRKVGLSASLSVVGLGPGKLFVRSDLGRPVIRALRAHVLRIGRSLRNTDVVVSGEYRALVMGLIEHKAPRINLITHVEEITLDMSHPSDFPLTSG